MFSCLLLHSSNCTEPLLAQEQDVNIQVVGLAGKGKASARYCIDSALKDVVLFVPALIAHREATRQQLRLTDCQIELQGGGTVRTHSFQLAKAEGSEWSKKRDTLEFGAVKRRYKDVVSAYCGAVSFEDVLLHVGDIPAGSELVAHFKFLLKFTSAASSSLQYRVHNRLLARRLSYTLSLASPSVVESVSPPTCTARSNSGGFSTSPMDSLVWERLGGSNQSVVQVSYDTCSAAEDSDGCTPCSSGFVVQLAGNNATAGCCSSVVLQDSPSTNSGGPICGQWDGVMMLNTTFGRDLLPLPAQSRPLYPSEFVFVVDCSGSMSGTNIQSAADTLITCIKSLPEGCYFNVIAFGSTFRHLFHTSVEYSQRNMERAVQFANQLQASLGGTELLAPLKWIFKCSRCSGLPCQVFIITDGGVPNTQAVVHAARKNRHQARCHTFGIGSEVCVELVTGIAAASGGKCTLLSDGERLQTKVMEVLKESLQPHVTDSVLSWNPPEGYLVADTSPKNLGTLYSGNSYTAFAFLKKEEGSSAHSLSCSSSQGDATITGRALDEEVQIEVKQAMLPALSEDQNQELSVILGQGGAWSKLTDLEMQALSLSRKNSHDASAEPPAKRPRLNGLNGVNGTHSIDSERKLCQHDLTPREELIELSLESGVPCALTCFASDRVDDSSRTIAQILPQRQNPPISRKVHMNNGTMLSYQRIIRKRKRHIPASVADSNTTQTFSLSSLAKNSITVVGSTLKSVVNFATFGLLSPESSPPIEPGWQRMDDQIEIQKNKDSQLYWDEGKGQLVYPSFYYLTHPSNHGPGSTDPTEQEHHGTKHSRVSKARKSSRHAKPSSNMKGWVANAHSWKVPTSATATANGTLIPTINGLPPQFLRLNDSSQDDSVLDQVKGCPASPEQASSQPMDHSGAEDDEEFTISDTESDSSVDPDWEDLQRPRELLPLLQMQLFSGAWPLIRAFSYAVGVPLEEVRKLPLKSEAYGTSAASPPNGQTAMRADCDESKSSFWTTALAIACLEEYFEQYHTEWELVALKGQCWLKQNSHLVGLDSTEVQSIARELVLRRS